VTAIGWWISPGPPVSSTNKTDRHDIAEILLKVALNTIKQTISLDRFHCILFSLWFQVGQLRYKHFTIVHVILIVNHFSANKFHLNSQIIEASLSYYKTL
jgi:hypothetical protein